MQTQTVTLVPLNGATSAAVSRGGELLLKTTALDANGNASGAQVLLSSSDVSIAKFTTAEQQGAAPAGVVGVGVGTATLTATASDNSAAFAKLAVTVS